MADSLSSGANSGSQRVQSLLEEALKELRNENAKRAFDLLIPAKADKVPTRNVDYVRALCFVKMGRMVEAKESLKEELRYFADNEAAKELLSQVEANQQTGPVARYEEEFEILYSMISPYTMLSRERLYSLFSMARKICVENTPGNFVECGVAAGGSSALLAYVIKRYSKQPRWLYSFDSFDGMPPPTEKDAHGGVNAQDTGWGTGTCAASERSVMEACAKVGAADVLRPVKGLFQDTLPKMRDHVGMISLLHLDGDWYESTKVILENLYDHVVNNGAFQVDDYGYWEGCREAVHEFEQRRGLKFSLRNIDGTGVSFSKPNNFRVNPALTEAQVQDFRRDDVLQHGIVSQMSENERFQLYYAVRAFVKPTHQPLRFVEVGSYAGASLLLSYMALRRLSDNVQGFAVEPAGEGQFYEVMRILSKDVAHLMKFSDAAAPELQAKFSRDQNFAQFILIDGDHTYDGVARDILNYYPLLAPGGVIMFHDFLPALDDKNRDAIYFHHANQEPGIRRACLELMEGKFGCTPLELPLLHPDDPTQTQAHLPIIPGVFSTIRAYRKPNA